MENREQGSTEKGKFELKEYIQGDELKDVLRKWLDALENDQDLVVKVKGQDCTISNEVLQSSKVKLEYEIKNGEYEFELEMKWRKDNNSLRQ